MVQGLEVGRRSCFPWLALSVAVLAASPASTQQPIAPVGSVDGRVVDAQDGSPIAGATVRLRELGRGEVSHEDGSFHFERVRAGSYTVRIQRIGYAAAEARVQVPAGGSATPTIELTSSALSVGELVVTGTGVARSTEETYRPTTVLGGAELRRRLGATLTGTLAGEAGLSQRYNGPGGSQPVIRGLGGDRVLVLEDGGRTGDIAGSAADHGVTVEPLTAERVEVVRGPATLLYGSNALGGVINVIREEVPRSIPDRPTGAVSLQGESASTGVAAALAGSAALGDFALRGEVTGRHAGDTRTPLGELPSTGLRGYTAAVGASHVGPEGFAGVSVRSQASRYGVPGVFRGVQLPGAHERGAEVDIHRTAVRGEAALLRSTGPFRSFEVDGGFVRFGQEELERGEDGVSYVGNVFRQQLGTLDLRARHGHPEEESRFAGALGIQALARRFDAVGGSTGSRSADHGALGVYAYEEIAWRPFRFEVGGRYDVARISPRDDRPVEGVAVRDRTFGALSASGAAIVALSEGVQVGARLARSFRTPSVEELFSRGPHLAAFSYEIGNPGLDAERGVGADLFLRVARDDLHGELTAYRNAIDNFIHYAPTGELDPRLGAVPVYRAVGEDALLRGLEASLQWEPVRGWVAEGTASYVRGELSATSEPLVAMPPARGSIRVRRDVPRYFVELGVEGARAQERPGEFETRTPGYGLLNGGAGIRWETRGRLHTLTLQGDNLTDRVWYDHLSRLKELAPQPGVNLRLLYRVDL